MNSYRELTLWQIHNILLQLNYTQADKQQLLYALNGRYTEPLPTTEIDRILSQTKFYNNLQTCYIIEILDITTEEQEQLKALVAPELKALRSREKQKQDRQLQKQQKLDQRLQKVTEMAKANCTQAEIAKELNLSVRTIKNYYKSLGISKQKNSRDAVVELRDQGFSQAEVAEKLKISIRTVRKYWHC